jgi:hypothetical protein
MPKPHQREDDIMKTLLATRVARVGIAATTMAHLAGAAPVPADFVQARLRLERGHYADAHRRFAQLADCGHRESARVALEMRQPGPQRYRMSFQVGPERLARWRALLAAPAPLPAQAGSSLKPACGQLPPAEAAGEGQEYWRHYGVG